MKQTLKIGAMLLVVPALAMSGVALAQSGDDEAAAASPAADRPLYSRILAMLEPLVADDTISQSQAEAVAETLAEAMPAGMPRMHRGLEAIRETAAFLDMTAPQVLEALREGATLAEIAREAGSSGEALIDHLVGVLEGHLDEAVEAGRITEERKAEILGNATERITDLVNGELERPFAGRPGHGPGPGMFPGDGGEGFGPAGPGA